MKHPGPHSLANINEFGLSLTSVSKLSQKPLNPFLYHVCLPKSLGFRRYTSDKVQLYWLLSDVIDFFDYDVIDTVRL